MHHLAVELDVEASTPHVFGGLARSWFESASRALHGGVLERLVTGPPLPADPWTNPSGELVPYGTPGLAWGELHVSWPSGRNLKLRHAKRTYSAANVEWFYRRIPLVLEESGPPVAASMKLSELSESGYPGSGPHLDVEARKESPGWIRLLASVRAAEFTDPESGGQAQRRWLDFLAGFADGLNPSFGGGVWLLATEDFRDYDLTAAEQVFDVLAPVLRRGQPQDPVAHYPLPHLRERAIASRPPLLTMMRDAGRQ